MQINDHSMFFIIKKTIKFAHDMKYIQQITRLIKYIVISYNLSAFTYNNGRPMHIKSQ